MHHKILHWNRTQNWTRWVCVCGRERTERGIEHATKAVESYDRHVTRSR